MRLLAVLALPILAAGMAGAAVTVDDGFGNHGGRRIALQHTEGELVDGLVAGPRGTVFAVGMLWNPSDHASVTRLRSTTFTVDPTYGEAGTALVREPNGYGGEFEAAALDQHGRLVAVGIIDTYPAVARFLPDGRLDATFGAGGVMTTGGISSLNGVAIRADDSIVAVGPNIVRLTSTGAVDASFGSGGYAPPVDGFGPFGAVIADADGTTLVLGERTSDNLIAVLRLDASGLPDASFGAGGVAATPMISSSPAAMAESRDGSIIVTSMESAVRFRPDGSLDTAYGQDGVATIPKPANELGPMVVAAAADSDGGVTIALDGIDTDDLTSRTEVARLRADGSPDPAFAGGSVLFPVADDGSPARVIALADGSHLLALRTTTHCVIAHFLADGSIDSTVGTDGVGTLPLGSEEDHRPVVKARPGGGYVVAETIKLPFNPRMGITCLRSDGSTDPTFGEVLEDFGSPDTECQDVVALSDRRVVVVGRTGGNQWYDPPIHTFVARYLPDGTRDPSFGVDGVSVLSASDSDDRGMRVAVDADGSLVVLGTASFGSWQQMFLARLRGDGSLVETFGTSGYAYTAATDVGEAVTIPMALALQPDGRIVYGGAASLTPFIGRLLADGTPDTTFGTGAGFTFGSWLNAVTSIEVEPDGKLVVAAGNDFSGSGMLVARILGDGRFDPAFNGGAPVPVGLGPAPSSIFEPLDYQARALPDGSIIAVGARIEAGASVLPTVLARLLPHGSRDESFGTDGFIEVAVSGQPSGAVLTASGLVTASTFDGDAWLHRFVLTGFTGGATTAGAGTGASSSSGSTTSGDVIGGGNGGAQGGGCGLGGSPAMLIALGLGFTRLRRRTR